MRHAIAILLVATLLAAGAGFGRAETLENENVVASFDDNGLVSLYDKQLEKTLEFSGDHWSFVIEHHLVDSRFIPAKEHKREAGGLRYFFREGEFDVEVLYQLKPRRRFVTKQLFATSRKSSVYTVRHVDVFHGQLDNRPESIFTAGLGEKVNRSRGLGDYAAFVRMNDRWGGMFMMQNPFSVWEYQDGSISMGCRADLIWKDEYGPFASDRACVGLYERTGQLSLGSLSHRPSWLLEPEWISADEKIDMGEIEAAIQCVRAFLLYYPTESQRIHVPWCENDYQIDVATEDSQAQFRRIVDTCSALGIRHMLYTVRNEDVALQEDASDNWHWEHLLWLNQGIQIRKNLWDPRIDELPAKTQKLQQYAESKNVKLMAYVYPTLAFEHNADFLTTRSANNPQIVASFGSRAFQDWFVDTLIAFKETTGVSGYAFVIYDRDFNIRDWDYLGWKFSLFSSIATAPFAHCVDMIPARDAREFELFSRDVETQRFIRDWFDWTDENAEVLRNLRSIIGPPAIGCADGTAAMDGDHGFIFLFNPNHRKITAEFMLDASLGLTRGGRFVIKHLFPEDGKYS